MDNQNLDEKIKMLTFRENESNKVDGVKKVIASKPFVALLTVFLCFLITSLSALIVSSVTDPSFKVADIGTVIMLGVIEMLLPLLLLRLLYLANQVARGKAKEKYNNSILTRIFALRRFAKVFLILMAIFCIVDGLYYINMESMYYANEETFKQMDMVLDSEQLAQMVSEGRHYLFQGICFAFLAYGSLKAFKVFFKSIIVDERDNKYIEILIIIGLLGIYALLLILGNVLALAGVETFLVLRVLNPHSPGDILSFVTYILLSGTLILGAYIIYLIRKALIENYGSSNPLAQDVVYTIDISDEDHKE